MTKLSPAERAMLINQFRILAAVEKNPTGYDHVITILDRGYEAEYEENIEGLSEPFDAEDSKFVIDIMFLYYLMKLTKNKAALDNPGGDRDKSGRLRLENCEPKFPGFDGNNQTRHLSYAEFLIKSDRFAEHNHYLNSHGSEPDYERMIETWEGWGRPTELTDQQVDELLKL